MCNCAINPPRKTNAPTLFRRNCPASDERPMPTRLEKAREKAAQAEARLKQLEAIERTKERKRANRRSLLIGSAIQAAVDAGKFSESQLTAILDEFITKPNERTFLGLSVSEPKAEPQEPAEAKEAKTESSPQSKPQAQRNRLSEIMGRTASTDDDDLASQFNL